MTPEEHRSEYIAGLRMLADVLEQNPDLELPWTGSGSALNVIPIDNQRAAAATWAKAMPGKVEKKVRGDSGAFDLIGSFRGLKVQVICDRDQVCERVVTGTEVVKKTVPDPSVEVPTIEVEETVETIEWRCAPLLAGGRSDDHD